MERFHSVITGQSDALGLQSIVTMEGSEESMGDKVSYEELGFKPWTTCLTERETVWKPKLRKTAAL